jgi:hypothetical protein
MQPPFFHVTAFLRLQLNRLPTFGLEKTTGAPSLTDTSVMALKVLLARGKAAKLDYTDIFVFQASLVACAVCRKSGVHWSRSSRRLGRGYNERPEIAQCSSRSP